MSEQKIRGDASPLQQVYAERAYTANGKEAWIKDANANQTTYSYDAFDRLRRTTFPNATYEELSYDAKGNLLSKLTRGGQLIVNTYDSLDRLATHSVPQPAGPAILATTTYDLAGRTTQISDNAGHSLSYAFDSAKRPASVTQAAPTFSGTRIVAYQLDQNGNKTRTTWADGYYVQYQYDALNRMTTASENGTFLLATYVYDYLDRRTSLVTGNGASQSYSYTTQGDLLTLASTLTGTTNTYTNTFTKAHQLASESASNTAWGYVPATFQTTAYSAANNLNQYVTITVGANPAVTMAYDANGNLTGDGVWTFAYDAQNMLRSAVKSGGSASYDYDPLGRRQMLSENGTTTTFLHDGAEEIADYASTTVLRRYVPGPGTDQPIAMVTPSGGSNTRAYFHTNRQGSTVAMSADSGTIGEGPYTYDAYGNGAPATGVPFKYTGRRLDPGTGLYYYRARYYSATLGRFLQVDPVGYDDQMNLYGYVGNDPLNLRDPRGQIATGVTVGYTQVNGVGGSWEVTVAIDWSTGEIRVEVKAGAAVGLKRGVKVKGFVEISRREGSSASASYKVHGDIGAKVSTEAGGIGADAKASATAELGGVASSRGERKVTGGVDVMGKSCVGSACGGGSVGIDRDGPYARPARPDVSNQGERSALGFETSSGSSFGVEVNVKATVNLGEAAEAWNCTVFGPSCGRSH